MARTLTDSLKALFETTRLEEVLRAAKPPLLFGVRLWASVCLALYVAFWLELDNPSWAGITAVIIVCQPQLGAPLRKGWIRIVGTVVGSVAIVVLTACFPQARALFLISLALWGAACTFVSTILRNFASYAAALAGYTAVTVASGQLGATGGLNGDAFMLAVTRVTEISIGIVSADIVRAGTDLGGVRRQLATLLASLAAEIMAHFTSTLLTRPQLSDTQAVRRDLLHRVINLDPITVQTLGESTQIRHHSPVLERAHFLGVLPLHIVKEMVFSGNPLSAEDAFRFGLLNRRALLRRICGCRWRSACGLLQLETSRPRVAQACRSALPAWYWGLVSPQRLHWPRPNPSAELRVWRVGGSPFA